MTLVKPKQRNSYRQEYSEIYGYNQLSHQWEVLRYRLPKSDDGYSVYILSYIYVYDTDRPCINLDNMSVEMTRKKQHEPLPDTIKPIDGELLLLCTRPGAKLFYHIK